MSDPQKPLGLDQKAFTALQNGDSGNPGGQDQDRLNSIFKAMAPVNMEETSEKVSEETEISAGQKMLAAMSGSLLTSLLVTPLDVVRVRLQSQAQSLTLPSRSFPLSTTFANLPPKVGVTACCREAFWVTNTSSVCMVADSSLNHIAHINPPSSLSSSASDCVVDESRRKSFNSTFDGLRKIARHEGLGSLWRGLSPTLLMAIPGNVIYFTGYDYLRASPRSPINAYVPEAYAPLIAGSVARVAAASVVSPIEMFRTRLQAATSSANDRRVFTQTLIGLKNMVHSQGYTSLWRGLTLTMWRDVPFSGIYWWGYETVRNRLTDFRRSYVPAQTGQVVPGHDQTHTNTFVDSFIAGAASGSVAAFITTPFDVGKTRKQVLEHSYSSPGDAAAFELQPEERSMPRFLHQIWKEEGAAGLFRGWAARCLKIAPACAIMISSYEIGKKIARSANEQKRTTAAARP